MATADSAVETLYAAAPTVEGAPGYVEVLTPSNSTATAHLPDDDAESDKQRPACVAAGKNRYQTRETPTWVRKTVPVGYFGHVCGDCVELLRTEGGADGE